MQSHLFKKKLVFETDGFMEIIADIQNDYKEKFGIPRQSGLSPNVISKIIFRKEYRVKEALMGLSEYSHLWILWDFNLLKKNSWSPTVRPPVLGGNKRVGVFATRSPNRPNSIGLSCVKIEKISYDEKDSPIIYVSGADMADGTPVYDIKPYIPYADCIPDAVGSFSDSYKDEKCAVIYDDRVFEGVKEDIKDNIIDILSLNPCPRYIDDNNRVFGMTFGDWEIKFTSDGNTVKVISVM